MPEYIFLHGAKRVSWDGIQKRTNFSFRGRTSLSAIVEKKDRCLPSEARLDSPSERRSRKGKSSPEERKASEFVISVPRTHNWHHRGTHFLSLWRLFNHKSTYCTCKAFHAQNNLDVYFYYHVNLALRYFFKAFQVDHAYFIIENFAAKL